MEPRTSSPAARLRAIHELSSAGVPVNVLVAPVVPGLTDHEMPTILKAVSEAGAETASYILLRLPGSVKPVFLEWLERTQPDLKTKIEARIRDTRGGELYETGFGVRMTGRGEVAEQIGTMFKLFARKYSLDGPGTQKDLTLFRRPAPASGQQLLFR
jgi:DNA repair photolyase